MKMPLPSHHRARVLGKEKSHAKAIGLATPDPIPIDVKERYCTSDLLGNCSSLRNKTRRAGHYSREWRSHQGGAILGLKARPRMNRLTHKQRYAAYEAWVHAHSADLYRVAYRLSGDADIAEDLVQEAFYHAWKDMDKLRDADKARAWLLQILRHRYAHWVRAKDRRVRPQPLDPVAPAVADPARDVLSTLGDREALTAALGGLDSTMKVPLVMVYVGGLTCQETADQLDVPLGTVLSRIHRARQKLRSNLDVQQKNAGQMDSQPSDGNTNPGQLRLRGGA